LLRKVKLAAIFGTIQSTLTNFNYIHPDWKVNCESERLLGVDITGQWDNINNLNDPFTLKAYRDSVVKENEKYAKLLSIPNSASTTCVKPSGNSSQLLDCSSGCHPRYSPFYIRRLRIGAKTPMAEFLMAHKVPVFPEVGSTMDTASVLVFEFPVKSPANSLTKNDLTAIDQLNHWLNLKTNYTEHNPSATIYFDEPEVLSVAAWVWEHWNYIGGLSFLQRDGGIYQLAPYEEITEHEYHRRIKQFPTLDFSTYHQYEPTDTTTHAGEFACTGDRCEI
jgi:hypothetical protein